jgi:hypothetical protein
MTVEMTMSKRTLTEAEWAKVFCQDEPILAYQDGSGAWQPATRISNHTGLELVLVRVVEKASS